MSEKSAASSNPTHRVRGSNPMPIPHPTCPPRWRGFAQRLVSLAAGRARFHGWDRFASLPRESSEAPWLDNADLLHRVAASDSAAFEQLYENLAPPMFSLVLRMVERHADAEDILQSGFHQVWCHARDYRVDLGSPFAWISTIMRRKAIDSLRARRRHGERMDAAFICRMGDL